MATATVQGEVSVGDEVKPLDQLNAVVFPSKLIE